MLTLYTKSFGASGNCNNCPHDAYKCQYYNEHTLMEFCERIDDAPTIDVVEVVRCKDCKYMTEHYDIDGNVPYWTCSEWDSGTDYDGYCHLGERREDAKTDRCEQAIGKAL